MLEEIKIELLLEKRKEIEILLKELGIDSTYELYEKMIAYKKDGSARIIISKNRNKINGLLWMYKVEKKYHLNYLIIKEEFRSKKIGSKLLKKAYELALIENALEIELNVNKENIRAFKFYKNEKFEVIKEDNEKILLKLEIK